MASADGKFFLALRDKLLVAGGVGFLLLWMLSGFYLGFVFLVCLGSLAYAADLTAYIMDSDAGTSEMTVIADAIREGAEGFLQTQYGAIMRVSGIVTLLLAFLYLVRPGNNEYISRFSLAIITAVGFMLGAFCSALAGAVGVWISVRCNVRVSSAAARHKTGEALKLAFCGGAVSSIISAAMCILVCRGAPCRRIWSLSSSSGMGSERALLLYLCSSVAVFTPRPPTWGRTWWARWSRTFPRTTTVTRLL